MALEGMGLMGRWLPRFGCTLICTNDIILCVVDVRVLYCYNYYIYIYSTMSCITHYIILL